MKYFLLLSFLTSTIISRSQSIDGVPDSLPANMFPDAAHAPFYHGVGSFDPTAYQVIIWTKITPFDVAFPAAIHYQVATDSLFQSIIVEADTSTTANENFTFSIDINGLNPNTKYFYRFRDLQGNYSVVGQTHTLPNGPNQNLKIAVASCSSVYSGFFNAYRHMASDTGILALFHLGDYIYDFVDPNELIRIPFPFPEDPVTSDDYRQRHAYYLLDPDLRYARQMKPFFVNWDNHDIDNRPLQPTIDQGIQPFSEYCPWRRLVPNDNEIIYRKVSFGDLLEVSITDLRLFRFTDTLSNGETNLLGTQQFEWLTSNLKASNTKWQIIGSQKMIGGWYTSGFPSEVLALIPNEGPVFDDGGWDGRQETRNMLFDTTSGNAINNCIFITGDSHCSFGMDLSKTPQDSLIYNPETGEGSIGVEFAPTSISRGNFDESGISGGFLDIYLAFNKIGNPQQYYNEFTKHGYGILDIKSDSVIATYVYLSKDSINPIPIDIKTLTLMDGINHWKRYPSGVGISKIDANQNWKLYPNPNSTGLLNFSTPQSFQVYNSIGNLIYTSQAVSSFSLYGWASGFYTLKNQTGQVRKLVIFAK